jgi:hypothetical protein
MNRIKLVLIVVASLLTACGAEPCGTHFCTGSDVCVRGAESLECLPSCEVDADCAEGERCCYYERSEDQSYFDPVWICC